MNDSLKVIALATIGFALIYLLLNLFMPRFLIPALRLESLERPMNILILGTDAVYDERGKILEKIGRSDVMVLVNLNPFLCRVNLLSIPRDTMASIEGHGINKINAATVYGGGDLAKKTVSRLLKVPVDAYVLIDTDGLVRLIDILGGVRVYVDRDMYYRDRAGHLDINLKKGWHKLSGKETQGYLRYRKDESLGDVGRIQRQQHFLEYLFKKLASPFNILRAPWLIALAREKIKTDLGPRNILKLMNFSRMIRPQDIKMAVLPGNFSEDPKISYWLPDIKESQRIAREFFTRGRWIF